MTARTAFQESCRHFTTLEDRENKLERSPQLQRVSELHGDIKKIEHAVQEQIEQTVAKLKAVKDPFLGREILKKMRALLSEADRALKKPAQ
jgi:hypothetical protein